MQLETAKRREVGRRKIRGDRAAVQCIELPFRRVRERRYKLLGSLIAVLSDHGSPETKFSGYGDGRLELIADMGDQKDRSAEPRVGRQGGFQQYDFAARYHRDIDRSAIGCICDISAAAGLDVGIDTVCEVSPRVTEVRGVRVHSRVRRQQRHYGAAVGVLA